MRTQEIVRLEWKDIRFEQGVIEVAVEKAKTISRAKLEVGGQSQADVLTAENEVTRVEKARRDLLRGVSDNETQLKVLMNRDPFSPLGKPATSSAHAALPPVERVFGKAGQSETPTDPAPLAMFETVVTLKPHEQWRPGMTWEKLIAEMNAKIKTPGMANIFWMPIQTRTEMLTTGFRTIPGVKVFGADLKQIENVAVDIEKALSDFPNTRSVFAERDDLASAVREALSRWKIA